MNFKGYEFWKIFNSNILNKWSFFSGKYCDCQCQIEINVCNNCNLCSYKFISKMPFSYSGLTMIFLVSIQVQKLQMNSLSMFEKVKSIYIFSLMDFLGGAPTSIFHFFHPPICCARYIRNHLRDHLINWWYLHDFFLFFFILFCFFIFMCHHEFWCTCVKWWYLQVFFFSFFSFFWVDSGAKNGTKWCLSCFISQEPNYLFIIISFFSKFWFSGLLGGWVKGQKMNQNGKIF